MNALVDTLRKLEKAGKADAAKENDAITKAKLAIMKTASPTEQDKVLAREALEIACVLAVRQRDLAAFERHMQQLKRFYRDEPSLPPSTRRTMILGLNLLYLLVQTRIAEFHTELELIPLADREDKHLQHPITLEQHLMEGSYNNVYTARTKVPDALYQFFMDELMVTLRDEIADCCTTAYETLAVADAVKMLFLADGKELQAIADKHEWKIDGNVVQLRKAEAQEATIPAYKVIKETLHYAAELERIV